MQVDRTLVDEAGRVASRIEHGVDVVTTDFRSVRRCLGICKVVSHGAALGFVLDWDVGSHTASKSSKSTSFRPFFTVPYSDVEVLHLDEVDVMTSSSCAVAI